MSFFSYVKIIKINMSEIEETLKEIKEEDIIWIIYIFLVIFALVSNYFEKEFVTKRKKKDEKTFRSINIFIFSITFLIYLYFVYINYKHVKKLDSSSSLRDQLFTNASFISSILFLIGGTIALLIAIFGTDEDNFAIDFF